MAVYALSIWLFVLLLPLLLLLKKIVRHNQQLPPGPPKLPVVGNFHQLGALPHQSLKRLSQKYGAVMFLKLGRTPLVVISSAEAAREVLKIHDLDCCSRPLLTGTGKLSYNYLDIGFAPYGDHWRQMRKMSTLELFSLKRVQSFRFIREEEVALLIDSITESSSSATPVDISEKMFGLTGSIVFRMAFGKRFRGSNYDGNNRLPELIHAAESLASFSAEECFPNFGWIIDRISGYHGKLEGVFLELDTLLQELINDHLKPERTKQEQEDFIDVMLKMEREQTETVGEARLTKNHIKAVLMVSSFPY